MKINEQFFYDNAGFSYNPETESEEHGKLRCARIWRRCGDELAAIHAFQAI
jgi:hypothetical protein